VTLNIPGRVVVFDFGEVISLAPSAADREELLAIATSGGGDFSPEAFWTAYEAGRDALDLGSLDVVGYWHKLPATGASIRVAPRRYSTNGLWFRSSSRERSERIETGRPRYLGTGYRQQGPRYAALRVATRPAGCGSVRRVVSAANVSRRVDRDTRARATGNRGLDTRAATPCATRPTGAREPRTAGSRPAPRRRAPRRCPRRTAHRASRPLRRTPGRRARPCDALSRARPQGRRCDRSR
jgi:hypothetical protein